VQTFGYPAFGWVIGVTSWLLVIPVVIVARLSTLVEREEKTRREAKPLQTEALW
jgi:hypothetical protein